MELTKKQILNKVLSFNYSELADWIRGRLWGKDPYFPIHLGHEPNLGEFLNDIFHHIKDEKFRCDFLEILGDLTLELKSMNSRKIEESKLYISELLFLCGNIERFNNKTALLEIAVSGNFKGNKIENSDLHAALLTTLASFSIAGTSEFWIKQLEDTTEKSYANPSFYALKDYPKKLFDHIGVFIDKYNGEAELVLGIVFLIEEYGKKKVFNWFNSIQSSLSLNQRIAVNQALVQAGYDKLYKEPPTKQFIFNKKNPFSKNWQIVPPFPIPTA